MILSGFIFVLIVLNLYKFSFSDEDLELEIDAVSSYEHQNIRQPKTNADTVESRVSLAWLKPVASAEMERDIFALETYNESPDIQAQIELKPLRTVEKDQPQVVTPNIEVVAVTSSSGSAKALIRNNNQLFSVVQGSIIEDSYIVEKIENGQVYLKSVK